MVQKIHPQGVIWVPSIQPRAGHLSEKNDNLAVQYEDVHAQSYDHIKIVSSLKCADKDNLKDLFKAVDQYF